MKNINVIPTDKPSRLILQGSEVVLSKYLEINEGFSEFNQHIYITSDEEIKDCWVLNTHTNKVYFLKYYYGIQPITKKIILTTDQDLIKDGVQAIDDTFLEWFVNNPSCESVEIDLDYDSKLRIINGKNFGYYSAIIPQEEPKQDYSKIKEGLKKSIEGKAHFIQHFKNGGTVEEFKPLEPKQETLEEVAKEYASRYGEIDIVINKAVRFGAKWQQENMIEELEMHVLINEHDWNRNPQAQFRDFVEQFKNK
jgi:hypothetical protein